jgi:transcription antitermination factor NusG
LCKTGACSAEGEALSTCIHPIETAYSVPIHQAIPAEGADPNWYALMTRARNERLVVTRLEEWGIECYLPLISEVHRWKDRKKRVELPLFSCYVFVKMEMTNELRYRASNVDGAFGFVAAQGRPLPIPEEQIDWIRTLLTQQLPWSNHTFLKVGQRVRIRGGALDGIEGVLQSCNGERTLTISIDAIQRSLAMRIDGYQVEAV